MKHFTFFGLILATSFNWPLTVSAEKIGWHPNLVTALGRGIDLRKPGIIRSPVALIDTTNVIPGGGTNTGDAQVNITFSQHKLDLTRNLHLNSSLSIENWVVHGSVGLDIVDNQSSSQNTITFAYECTRNFGDRLYNVTDLAPGFISFVNTLAQSASGSDLHRRITDVVGTHFVSGYQSEARVVVLYTFEFASRTRVQQLNASLSATYDVVDFNSTVQSLLANTDTQASLSYKFWSSDPIEPGFAITNQIPDYAAYLTFVGQVDAYCRGLDPGRAKITSWIVEPLQNNLAYVSLLGGYSPTNEFNTGYERFLTTYSRLRSWEDTLTDWTLDARRMSWMNSTGQQQVISIRTDTTRMRQRMEEMARQHFVTGAPLDVPNDILNYFVNFNRIPIPTINVLTAIPESDSYSVYCGVHAMIGYVNYGNPDLTQPNAFLNIIGLTQGQENGDVVPLFHSLDDFAQYLSRAGGSCARLQDFYNAATNSPQWAALRNDARQCRIAGFLYNWFPGWTETHSLAIKDSSGAVIESQNLLTRQSIVCAELLQASTQTDIVLAPSLLPNAVAGIAVNATFTVTNTGPGSSYGITLNMPLSDRFEFVSVSGPQGDGSFTNGLVTYEVGPLGAGATTTVTLRVIPLTTEPVPLGGSAQVSHGEGLTDPNPADNVLALPPLFITPPRLSILKTGGQVQLTWTSDTDRLLLEQTSGLEAGPAWTQTTNAVDLSGSQRKITVGSADNRNFYRLHGF